MLKKIKLFYNKIPQGIKASIWFTVCSIIQKGIQLITVPFFTRILTAEQYGQYSLYQSWLSIISIFATLNLSSGVFNNGMLKYKVYFFYAGIINNCFSISYRCLYKL